MRKVLALSLIFIMAFNFTSQTAEAKFTYQAPGNKKLDTSSDDLMGAITSNLTDYAKRLVEDQLPTLDSIARDGVVEELEDDVPGVGTVLKVYDTLKVSAYAFTDLGVALAELSSSKPIYNQVLSAKNATEDCLASIDKTYTAAYQLGLKDRNTKNKVPIDNLEMLSNTRTMKNLANSIYSQSKSWYFTIFPSEKKAMRNAYYKLTKSINLQQDAINSFYNLGRYGHN